jgi:hypothetical protein
MARSHGLKTKTLRRMLKKKGMKTTGKKATLMKRLHLKGGATKAERDAAIDAAKALPESTEDEKKAKADALAAAEAMMEEEDQNAMDQEQAGKGRHRSRRREGGKRRSRRTKLNLDMYTRPTY